jgi:hypothetical protein
MAPVRIVELSPARLIIEDAGTGFGVVCVLAGHAIVGLALARPPWHLWLQAGEIALGLGAAVYGALLLTKTRIALDRIAGEIKYERSNFFRRRFYSAYFYEVEEVFLERGPREADPFRADPTHSYSFRPAIRVRGRDWPLARAYRDHGTALGVAEAVRAALDEFAPGPDFRLQR